MSHPRSPISNETMEWNPDNQKRIRELTKWIDEEEKMSSAYRQAFDSAYNRAQDFIDDCNSSVKEGQIHASAEEAGRALLTFALMKEEKE